MTFEDEHKGQPWLVRMAVSSKNCPNLCWDYKETSSHWYCKINRKSCCKENCNMKLE